MQSYSIYTTKQVEYDYTVDDLNKIINVYISGVVYEDDAAEIGLLFRTMALELNHKLYFDLSKSTIKISLGTAYFWHERKYNVVNQKFKFIPTAYFISFEQENLFNFYQNVCLNQGINTKIFKDDLEVREFLINVTV